MTPSPVPFFLDVVHSEENENTGIKKRLQEILVKMVTSLFFLEEDLKRLVLHTCLQGCFSVCRTVHIVCPAPNTPPHVLILLFAKPVCVEVPRQLGHQALILASRVMIGQSA